MSFIAVHAKADTQTIVKGQGRMTAAQAALLNSYSLSDDTGILDFGGRCFATASTIINNVSTVTFSSGYIVIYGRLIEVEEGTQITINTSQYPNGKIIARFDLSQVGPKEFEVIVIRDRTLIQNDLNHMKLNGVYELELCAFSADTNSIKLTNSATEYIKSNRAKFEEINTRIDNVNKSLEDYDNTKGTIENRFAELEMQDGYVSIFGFREKALVYNSICVVGGFANYKINITQEFAQNTLQIGQTLFELKDKNLKNLIPNTDIYFTCSLNNSDNFVYIEGRIDENGKGVIDNIKHNFEPNIQYLFTFNFGFQRKV